MERVIGVVILATIFIGLFFLIAATYGGVAIAAAVIGVSIAVAAAIILAVNLIAS